MLKFQNKYVNLILVILLLIISFYIVFNFTAGFETDVDNYIIENVSNDTVYIKANLDNNYLLYGLVPYEKNNINSSIITDNLYSDTLRYKIKLNKSEDRRQFITDENVFLKNYKIRNDDNLDTNIVRSNNLRYKSVYTTENTLILYLNNVTRTTKVQNRNKISVVSRFNESQDEEIINSGIRMSNKFNNKQSIYVYIIDDNPTRWGGYAYSIDDSVQTVWVSDAFGDFSSEKVLMHEVIHAHQDFNRFKNMEWIFEGSAEYVSTLTYLNKFDKKYTYDFQNRDWYNNISSDESIHNISLRQKSSWTQGIEYSRGEHVLHLIDYSLRYHTDCQYNIYDTMIWLNKKENINYNIFRQKIKSKTDRTFVNKLDDYLGKRGEIDLVDEKKEIAGKDYGKNIFTC